MNLETLLQADANISNKLRIAETPGLIRNLSAVISHSGDSWYLLLVLLIVSIVGNEFWKTRAAILMIAILATATIIMVLKFSIRRKRPEGDWGDIYRRTDPHSFPSGHAARALMLGVVGLGIGPSWFGWILAIWGPFVGLARVAMGVHYVSDVLAGWIVGFGLGLIILQFSQIILL